MVINTESLLKGVSISIFIGAIAFSAYKFLPAILSSTSSTKIVTFDVIKYSNAQRAVASAFLTKSADIGGANEILLKLPDSARDEIRRQAGSNAIVLVKQAVVQGAFEDITDKVLKELRLPLDVPTADATAAAIDIAPSSFTMGLTPEPSTNRSSSASQVLP